MKPEVPLPPFTDPQAALRFANLLGLYLRELKEPGDQIGMLQFTTAAVAQLHRPSQPGFPVDSTNCGNCAFAYPCPTTLVIAGRTGFPVPWTPHALATLMSAHDAYRVHFSIHRNSITFGDGGEDWTGFTRQRGQWRHEQHHREEIESRGLVADARIIEILLRLTYPSAYPYGYRSLPESDVDLVKAGVRSGREAWNAHAALPYLETERHHGVPWAPAE